MKIGYIRVSTQEQNTMRQEVLMEALKLEMLGKKIGVLALPPSDMEQFYEEMKITGRWEL